MLSSRLRALGLRWLAEGRPAQLVQVLHTQGSVPREAGTRMLVAADAVAGTIGGGHLELQAIEQARLRLAQAAQAPPLVQTAEIKNSTPADLHPALAPASASALTTPRPPPADLPATTPGPWQQRLALGPSLGQCCGGVVTLSYQALTAATLAAWPATAPLFHLQLHGAGHVGTAIVALLAGIDCQVQWVDTRDDAFPSDAPLPPHIGCSVSDDPPTETASAPAGSLALVMTHRHDLDLAIVQALLARHDLPWVGLIGSATKRARFQQRLAQAGLPPEALARLHCPVGLPGIAGKAPAVVAVSVVAQLLALATGRPGPGGADEGSQAWASLPSAATSSTRTR